MKEKTNDKNRVEKAVVKHMRMLTMLLILVLAMAAPVNQKAEPDS